MLGVVFVYRDLLGEGGRCDLCEVFVVCVFGFSIGVVGVRIPLVPGTGGRGI